MDVLRDDVDVSEPEQTEDASLELIERLRAEEVVWSNACHHPLTYDLVED
jgi:hypothetical protein